MPIRIERLPQRSDCPTPGEQPQDAAGLVRGRLSRHARMRRAVAAASSRIAASSRRC